MLSRPASLALSLLRRLDPERAHGLALRALRLGLAGREACEDHPALAVGAFNLRFSNPIGLAAGFDKNAEAAGALMRLGFGFVETGTVTPLPQPGNARPRLFRLEEDRAVINRMGFNNAGLAAYADRLARLGARPAVLGANVGLNKEGADPERDYPALAAAVAGLADYVVINVSSPNTPGLRGLQAPDRIRSILRAIAAAAPRASMPLLVKVAPDLSEAALIDLVGVCVAEGVDGMIVSNTTLARPPNLRSAHAGEAGGLSGAPLFARSTASLATAFLAARGRLSLIGCGGVSTGRQAFEKILAGASLVQVYTAFSYEGPALIPRLKAELLEAVRAAGFGSVRDAIGQGAARIAQSASVEEVSWSS